MYRLLVLLLLIAPVSLSAQKENSKKALKGVGSFYANSFVGLPTATGEIFKHTNLTAASNSFKFHSWVKVTNLDNNKSVIVRINDRMAVKSANKGRVVDLTKAAAKQLGVGFSGLIRVLVEIVPRSETPLQ